MRVDLIQFSYDHSLALENLKNYALLDPTLTSDVQFVIHNLSLKTFERPQKFANVFIVFHAWELLLQELVEAKPAVVGLSCYLWNVELSIQFAESLKALLPETLVVLGGLEVTNTAERVMARHSHIDVVVRGEGEETFRELLVQVLRGRDYSRLAGTSVRLADQTVRHNPDRELIPALDVIPRPFERTVAENVQELEAWDRVLYETVRGCPHDCGFCLFGGGSRKVRNYDDERVIRDLLYYLRAGQTVMIVDPLLFGPKRSRGQTILDGVIAGGPYPGKLAVEAHPYQLDDEMTDRLMAASTIQIGIGLQTISSDANRLMHRRFDPNQYEGMLARLNERKLTYYIDIIYGLPGDSWQGFLDSMDFVLSRPGAEVQFYRLLVLPGTRFYRDAKQLGLVHADSPHYELLSTPTYSYQDLIRSHRIAFIYHTLLGYMGSGKATHRLISASRQKPSDFLMDLASFLEERHVMGNMQPAAMADTAFVLKYILSDFIKARGLQQAISQQDSEVS